MIKRLIASLGLAMCLCFTAMANKELSIKLDSKDNVYRENLVFGYLTFEYLYANGNNARVRVTFENTTSNPPHAFLIFRNDMTEQSLKKGKFKIEPGKTRPGKKGKVKVEFEKTYSGPRSVRGCRECNGAVEIIPAAVKDTIFMIDIPLTSPKDFTLPLYEAKYKAKDLDKKGAYNTNYKIMEEHLYDIHIEVAGWSENDPTYVRIKNAVDGLITSLKSTRFCKNRNHSPSLKAQQRPYQEKKDSLTKAISEIIDQSDWMSMDEPHIAYSELIKKLEGINFNDMTRDCGEHKVRGKGHSCGFCSLSAQEIYQRLDDLYQQLYAGNLTKEQALKTAKSLYNCYRQSKKRKKDSAYGTRISRFYSSIANY